MLSYFISQKKKLKKKIYTNVHNYFLARNCYFYSSRYPGPISDPPKLRAILTKFTYHIIETWAESHPLPKFHLWYSGQRRKGRNYTGKLLFSLKMDRKFFESWWVWSTVMLQGFMCQDWMTWTFKKAPVLIQAFPQLLCLLNHLQCRFSSVQQAGLHWGISLHLGFCKMFFASLNSRSH